MTIDFYVVTNLQNRPRPNSIELLYDNWDDYSFKTLFIAYLSDSSGNRERLGAVKIGFLNQTKGRTIDHLPSSFNRLSDNYFSLGQDPDYYENLMKLSASVRSRYLSSLNDIVADNKLSKAIENEEVFSISLLRSVSTSAIHGQYRRILSGGKTLTEFNFYYTSAPVGNSQSIRLDFEVIPHSLPPTNIHVIIGRNGVGKTTLLNSIISTIVKKHHSNGMGSFEASEEKGRPRHPMPDDYFSSVTSVAFSAFDPFTPIENQIDKSKGVRYNYIGLKKAGASDISASDGTELKKISDLSCDFITSLKLCFSLAEKRRQWQEAIVALEFDENFAEMNLSTLANAPTLSDEIEGQATSLFSRMSSGHKIVLLTITKLVETVEEKSLVLLDEPESHLHPPLLSAFARALSELLTSRNAVAIIATHSPVIVQEVPKSCVWKIRRHRNICKVERPESETFGENVGSLTREIFGLEVSKSGFHHLLAQSVSQGKDFEQVLHEYGGSIGIEGQAVLRAISSRGK